MDKAKLLMVMTLIAGCKCNINVCDDILIIHVCCAKLPSKPFPNPIR